MSRAKKQKYDPDQRKAYFDMAKEPPLRVTRSMSSVSERVDVWGMLYGYIVHPFCGRSVVHFEQPSTHMDISMYCSGDPFPVSPENHDGCIGLSVNAADKQWQLYDYDHTIDLFNRGTMIDNTNHKKPMWPPLPKNMSLAMFVHEYLMPALDDAERIDLLALLRVFLTHPYYAEILAKPKEE